MSTPQSIMLYAAIMRAARTTSPREVILSSMLPEAP